MTNRGNDWQDFSDGVLNHIETYTVPQYGDAPNDHVSTYTAAECVRQAEKYLKRFGKTSRVGEECLDMMKAAHFIQIAMTKMQGEVAR
jgi:hypothetical protein